jgi:hypothetical protein
VWGRCLVRLRQRLGKAAASRALREVLTRGGADRFQLGFGDNTVRTIWRVIIDINETTSVRQSSERSDTAGTAWAFARLGPFSLGLSASVAWGSCGLAAERVASQRSAVPWICLDLWDSWRSRLCK